MLKPRKRLVKAKLKEDKLVTRTAQVQAFVHENSSMITYVLLAVVALVAIGFAIGLSRASAERKATFVNMQARDAYGRGDLDETLTQANIILEDYPGTRSAATAMMLTGRVHEQRGEIPEAIEAFRKLIDKYDRNEYLSFAAYYSLGSIYYGQEEYQEAARWFSDCAARFPKHFNTPYSLLEAGRAYKKSRKYDQAKSVLRKILTDYPKSRAVAKAREELEKIEFMP